MSPEDPAATPHPQDRLEGHATLAAGLFTNGVWDMLSILVPLYAVAAGLSVAEIGFIVAARSVLPTALSIHGGILMDRWGTRRVLTRLSIVSMALPLVYPASSLFAILVVLQLILGLSSSLGMAGAQTWSLQASHGDTAALARFSIASRIGTFVGPVMIGAIWDAFGAWPAFACISLWAAGILGAAAYGAPPRAAIAANDRRKAGLRDLLPRWAEHKDAFALAAIPAVAFILGVSFLRNSPGAIQSSFYVVYLGDVGLSGTMIGTLVGFSEFFGVLGSLVAAPLERVIGSRRLLLACIVSSIAAIGVTPLIGHFLVLLFVASAIRGVGQGVSQPLMYSILGRAVPSAMHGATVGLRNSVTRLASIVTPAFMGVVAGVYGVETSFYLIGGLFLAATLMLGFVANRMLAARDASG